MTNTQLPKVVQEQIEAKATKYMHAEVRGMVDFEDISPSNIKYAYEAGATVYALQLQTLQQDNQRLREALELVKKQAYNYNVNNSASPTICRIEDAVNKALSPKE
jgi:hypothetical protein